MHIIKIYYYYIKNILIYLLFYIICDVIIYVKGDEIMASLTTPISISVQIDKEDKERATEILQKLGVSMSGLINMTIKQLIMREKIPFEVALPKEENDLYKYFTNDELERTAKELAYIAEHPAEYKSYNNKKDLKDALLSDD